MSEIDDRVDPEDKDALLEGPAAENAYPEDVGIDLDGELVSLNDLSRGYNEMRGLTDESALIHVTAPELARELKVDPKVFRAWLRDEWRAGNEILAGHSHGQRWIFDKRDAGLLKVQYRRHVGDK